MTVHNVVMPTNSQHSISFY